MPVSKLLVEGKLDAILFQVILDGKPPVKQAGSKNALKPKVIAERTETRGISTVCYIRDRDFDLSPPEDRDRPMVHTCDDKGRVLGWYWCRHEMENYLLEPGIVARAFQCDLAAYRAALIEAATMIRDYQAARAAIGSVRCSLPPNHDFKTRPNHFKDDAFMLPEDLSLSAVSSWACAQATAFRERICPQLEAAAIERELQNRRELLSDAVIGSPEEILIWLAGKDILAALEKTGWFVERHLPNAGALRAGLRDWMRDNPSEVLDLLPEWQNFVVMLNEP